MSITAIHGVQINITNVKLAVAFSFIYKKSYPETRAAFFNFNRITGTINNLYFAAFLVRLSPNLFHFVG